MKCPISGQPCDKDKHIQFVQIVNAKKTEGKVCADCIAAKGFGSLLGSFGSLFGMEPVEDQPTKLIPLPVLEPDYPLHPNSATGNPVLDIFQKIFGGALPPNAMQLNTGIVCTGCNLSLGQARQIGRLGCPKCYESFKEYLTPVLQRCQEGRLDHVGKKPKHMPGFRQDNLESLREKMAEAIRTERFEEAAVLRDAIKQIEEEIKKEDLSHQQDQNPNNPCP